MIQTRQQVNFKHQVRRRVIDASIQSALTQPSKDELRAELAEAARNTAHQADQQRLEEIDVKIRQAGYWGARMSHLIEERAQIVGRIVARERAGA
jgi:hypothetical protein